MYTSTVRQDNLTQLYLVHRRKHRNIRILDVVKTLLEPLRAPVR